MDDIFSPKYWLIKTKMKFIVTTISAMQNTMEQLFALFRSMVNNDQETFDNCCASLSPQELNTALDIDMFNQLIDLYHSVQSEIKEHFSNFTNHEKVLIVEWLRVAQDSMNLYKALYQSMLSYIEEHQIKLSAVFSINPN